MKQKLLIFAFIGSSFIMNAQIKAVTENGDEVMLHNNGTYTFVDEEMTASKEIKLNTKEFTKPESATFLLKSTKTDVGFWLDPKIWSFGKPIDNPDAEYEVELKGEDLYGVIISEKIEIPIEYLKEIALENAKSVAPDIKIVDQEYRMVNGNKILFLRMDGTLQGMNITYYGYFFSNSKGTTQLIAFTAQNLLEEYQGFSEDLLNGLVTVE